MSQTFFNRRLRHPVFAGLLAVSLLPWLAIVPAGAAEPNSAIPDSQLDDTRYQMRRDGDGIIRLDRKTGTISRCQTRGTSLVCRMAADERTALEEEIAGLQTQLDELKTTRSNGDIGDDSSGPGKDQGTRENLQSENKSDQAFDKELNRAMEYSTQILRRFFTVMKELRKEMNE